jgi:hypothetical protein
MCLKITQLAVIWIQIYNIYPISRTRQKLLKMFAKIEQLVTSIEMGVARLELAHPLRITDFKSVASTIPPHPQVRFAIQIERSECVTDK